jgi:cytochrome c553
MRGNEIMTRLAILTLAFACICGNAAAAPPAAPDTIQARAQGCSTCHGSHGQGGSDEYFPRIAGKPQGYIFNQLQNFRDGRRSYPPMNYLLAYLHDDYLAELASFFASQKLTDQVPMGKASKSSADGERLAKEGIPARGIPPCMSCHGPGLTGIEPGIPALVGLHERYITAQIESWRVGTRRAKSPDCMHDIATRLNEDEIKSVAAWLASQQPPSPATPAAAGKWRTPLTCGSQP